MALCCRPARSRPWTMPESTGNGRCPSWSSSTSSTSSTARSSTSSRRTSSPSSACVDSQLGTMTGPHLRRRLLHGRHSGRPHRRLDQPQGRDGDLARRLERLHRAVRPRHQLLARCFLARMGVGLGEAGGSPPAHAMISDLYEKEKRGRALAIYSAGLYAGTLLGYYLGGSCRRARLAPGLLRRRHSRRDLRAHRLDDGARTGARPLRRSRPRRQTAHLPAVLRASCGR